MDRVPVEYIQKVDYRDDQDKIYEELKEMSRKFDENARSIKEDYNKRMDKMEKILTEQLTKRP
jgi:DNA anti-recombination protein RmuC